MQALLSDSLTDTYETGGNGRGIDKLAQPPSRHMLQTAATVTLAPVTISSDIKLGCDDLTAATG